MPSHTQQVCTERKGGPGLFPQCCSLVPPSWPFSRKGLELLYRYELSGEFRKPGALELNTHILGNNQLVPKNHLDLWIWSLIYKLSGRQLSWRSLRPLAALQGWNVERVGAAAVQHEPDLGAVVPDGVRLPLTPLHQGFHSVQVFNKPESLSWFLELRSFLCNIPSCLVLWRWSANAFKPVLGEDMHKWYFEFPSHLTLQAGKPPPPLKAMNWECLWRKTVSKSYLGILCS